jgi:hypothetical protein
MSYFRDRWSNDDGGDRDDGLRSIGSVSPITAHLATKSAVITIMTAIPVPIAHNPAADRPLFASNSKIYCQVASNFGLLTTWYGGVAEPIP